MIFTEKEKAFVKIFVPYYRLWTTESYERIPWQKTKYVWTLDWTTLSRSCLKSARMEYHIADCVT